MDNIYIKWKLKSFQIDIWYQKVLFDKKYLRKLNFWKFLISFLQKKNFFERKIFQIFFIQPPQIFFPVVVNIKNDNYMKV